MNYKEAQLKAKEIDGILNLGQLNKIIAVQHQDGTYLEFHHACIEKLDNEWYAVFSEHNGFHVYHFEDIKWIKELTKNNLYRYVERD